MVKYNSTREGKTISQEKQVSATNIYNAMQQVEDYCINNYEACEIVKAEEISK